MRRHILVVSEKKIKMLKTTFVATQLGNIRWCRHNSFLHITHLYYKHVQNIRVKFGPSGW